MRYMHFISIILFLLWCNTAQSQNCFRVYSANKEVLYYNLQTNKWELAYLRKTLLDKSTRVKSNDHFDVEDVHNRSIYHCGPSTGTELVKLIMKGYTPNPDEKGNTVVKGSEYDLITDENEGEIAKRNFHYMCVGVHDYQDTHWSSLAVPNVNLELLSRSISEVMLPNNGYNLRWKKLLYDKTNTTADSIRSSIQMLVDSIQDHNGGTDMVLLYLSGHGEKDASGQFHFIASDTRYDSLSGQCVNSITAIELNNYVNQLARKGTKVLIFVDACHSGAMRSSLHVDGSVVCYMSTEKDLNAYEYGSGGSPFAEALINSLSGKDDAFAYYQKYNESIVTPYFMKCYIQQFVHEKYKLQSPDYESFNIRPESRLWKIMDKNQVRRSKLILDSKHGDTEAMVKLGDAYYFGGVANRHILAFDHTAYLIDVMGWDMKKTTEELPDTMPVDYEKAYDYYLKAYQAGNSLAGCKLGICHYYGNGVPQQNYVLAMNYFQEAADNGIDLANYYLGVCYYKGTGVNKDKKVAKKYLKQVKDLGADIKTAYHTERVQCSIYKNGEVLILSANKDGDVGLIGMTSTSSDDKEKRPSLYVSDVEARAIFGNANSQAHMGFICMNGLYGRRVDTDMAYMWFKESANKGNKFGLMGLAVCYEDGIGVEKNEKKALEYYTRSCQLNNPDAYLRLGDCYYKGLLGLEKNEREAVICWKRAAELGGSLGQYKYGICYQIGMGLKQDNKKAFDWIKKSAKQGNAEAQYKLGCYYLDGVGTSPNSKAAYRWLLKAKKQGNKEAINMLEQHYYADGNYKGK